MSAVQVHDESLPLNEDSFCSSPLSIVRNHLVDSSTFPINQVVTRLNMYSDAMDSCHHLVVLVVCALQVGSCMFLLHGLTIVQLVKSFAKDLVNHFSLLLFHHLLLHLHKGLSQGGGWLEDSLDPT